MDAICGVCVRVIAFVMSALTAWKTAFLARSFKAIMTFSTGVAIGPTTRLSNLTESAYSGYLRQTVSALNGPALDALNIGYLTTNSVFFTHNGGPTGEQVFTAGLVGTVAGGVTATGTVGETGGVLDTPAVTLGGGPYEIPPHVAVTDPTGTGAVLHATIDGSGAVDTLVIDDGGTGYTLPVVVFDPPVELLAGLNFDAPVPMTQATDALPLLLQINLPTGV